VRSSGVRSKYADGYENFNKAVFPQVIEINENSCLINTSQGWPSSHGVNYIDLGWPVFDLSCKPREHQKYLMTLSCGETGGKNDPGCNSELTRHTTARLAAYSGVIRPSIVITSRAIAKLFATADLGRKFTRAPLCGSLSFQCQIEALRVVFDSCAARSWCQSCRL